MILTRVCNRAYIKASNSKVKQQGNKTKLPFNRLLGHTTSDTHSHRG